MNLFMLLGSVSARKCGSDAGTGARAVVVLWMLLVTMTFTTTASGPAWANERSRMFQDCMAFQMIAVESSTVDGDPNDAMSLAV
ncbi:hypothetical protein [Nioella aestuarii]|uniref:hypothetical protein n=1 Tax=Nioella aestuarii TaxID=1662864 RepID=UPI003D7F8F7E